jgi:hypothetical protein
LLVFSCSHSGSGLEGREVVRKIPVPVYCTVKTWTVHVNTDKICSLYYVDLKKKLSVFLAFLASTEPSEPHRVAVLAP